MSHPESSRTPQNGPAIRALREKDGLTVDQLATQVAITAPHLRNVELEHRKATPRLLNAVARVLQVPVGALVRDRLYAAAQDEDVA
jgi:transcriptional regulator with XRE-family HTH domain